MRAVLDPNVIISGLISREGSPAQVLLAWQRGEFELVVSRLLLAELERVLTYPKLRRHISADDAETVLTWLRESATTAPDPSAPAPMNSADPDDDYLIALAAGERAALVSGDKHLLILRGRIPVYSPREFLDLLV